MNTLCDFVPTGELNEHRCTRCGQVIYTDMLPIWASCPLAFTNGDVSPMVEADGASPMVEADGASPMVERVETDKERQQRERREAQARRVAQIAENAKNRKPCNCGKKKKPR